ncbi:MAG: hypothetical protein CVU20_08135 [Betaproteobacteria bacterium HGW-Betaproteobacteria-14]|nr:MAG: hypothetical protein CVU20_08135 [Betaproteobacteria bacterium HGW-Betaproteobacteria-14]
MNTEVLEPRLDLLQQEYVLVQAWKKTASYIRYHNWFSDTLELDRAAINLPAFIAAMAEALASPKEWRSGLLRMVPAPKSQRWSFSKYGEWKPEEKGIGAARLRPLAHVELRDQVVATAIMLCLANRVETLQGDPRKSVRDGAVRRQVISYGNRLFCDSDRVALLHRWGSAKLYRAYYQDYQTFLARPEIVAESIQLANGRRSFIVHSDLRQFYDRVRPDRLATALRAIQRDDDDPDFFDFAVRVFDWMWDPRDRSEVAIYARQTELDDFSRVALPQGLVSAGFFANVALLGFDEMIRSAIGKDIAPGVRLEDGCRYVDDLRIVVTGGGNEFENADCLSLIEECVSGWLQGLLTAKAPGLLVSGEKTKAAEFGGAERPLVRQSAKMNRIQSAVSGGFDAIGGEEVLDAIQGLMRSQEALSLRSSDDGWALSPLPDVRDETVARFAAARFRTTYRSIRPLLEDLDEIDDASLGTAHFAVTGRARCIRSQRQLDEDARAFSLGLIERWVFDPSNVRLLRIGLDLWPDAAVLEGVLKLLRPFTDKGGRRKAPRRVAWYCLSELLRAGATETGLVDDQECLPVAVDLAAYRKVLGQEAGRLVKLPAAQIPWYLRQQALLFLAAASPGAAPVIRTGRSAETRHYRELIRYLRGDGVEVNSSEFATLAVLARRSFSTAAKSAELVRQSVSPARIREIAHRDPSLARELFQSEVDPLSVDDLSARLREDLCLDTGEDAGVSHTLAEVVLSDDGPEPVLRNELAILRFAAAFLEELKRVAPWIEVIAPGQVRSILDKSAGVARIDAVEIRPSRASASDSLYSPPRWCENTDRWRFHLGFLLRFILSRSPDFTRRVRQAHWKESASAYRPAESHWYQRLYGFFNGQQAFGDDWLPITDWMEHFLSALLHWPGSRIAADFVWVQEGIDVAIARIRSRITALEGKFGNATVTLMLPMTARRPTPVASPRPLRACVVQTAVPADVDFSVTDLTLSDRAIRRKHRNHLSAALAAVERMLDLRETHKGSDGRLDWLILPELAVHPRDVMSHLIPFARAHKTIILAGLTYEELFSGRPLVNSALWIIPEWSDAHGLQIFTRRQGKLHLAPSEQAFNSPAVRLQGFRPCQWLIGFPWSSDGDASPLWLTASVCYDATDLRLAADLRNESDVFAIPALNRDVKTFDQMALALHYHMFQLVIVANNGQYGGSNAYWPSQDALRRQIFHLHGQPQASIAFLEIDDISEFLARHDHAKSTSPGWKYPPAGMSGK